MTPAVYRLLVDLSTLLANLRQIARLGRETFRETFVLNVLAEASRLKDVCIDLSKQKGPPCPPRKSLKPRSSSPA
jgi:hypothetical protein